jgi:hypothetical protein
MQVKGIEKEFTPIILEITIETQRELESFIILFCYTSAAERADFLNRNVATAGIKEFNGKDLIFMEGICNFLTT